MWWSEESEEGKCLGALRYSLFTKSRNHIAEELRWVCVYYYVSTVLLSSFALIGSHYHHSNNQHIYRVVRVSLMLRSPNDMTFSLKIPSTDKRLLSLAHLLSSSCSSPSPASGYRHAVRRWRFWSPFAGVLEMQNLIYLLSSPTMTAVDFLARHRQLEEWKH